MNFCTAKPASFEAVDNQPCLQRKKSSVNASGQRRWWGKRTGPHRGRSGRQGDRIGGIHQNLKRRPTCLGQPVKRHFSGGPILTRAWMNGIAFACRRALQMVVRSLGFRMFACCICRFSALTNLERMMHPGHGARISSYRPRALCRAMHRAYSSSATLTPTRWRPTASILFAPSGVSMTDKFAVTQP